MATLSSPGVSVSVIDESFYTPAAPGTVPLIFVASAANKANASGTGTAQGTLSANAGNVYVITSQRDLADIFGTPLFYTDTSGNAVHGGELNEYGLQAAYSLLGVSSRAYIARADIDLAQLAPQSSVPTGDPTAGTYWVDTANTKFGINEWNSSGQGSFTVKTPLIINNDNYLTDADSGTPVDAFGQQGDYAMFVTSQNANQLWYKTSTSTNAWVEVKQGFNGGKSLTISPHFQYPTYTTATTNGSVWVKTTTPGLGANWSIKYYNGSTESWNTVSANIYDSVEKATGTIDAAGGGVNIPVGTLFIDSNIENSTGTNFTANFNVWRRNSTSPTTVVFAASTATENNDSTFMVRETVKGSSVWSAGVEVVVQGSPTIPVAQRIPAALSAAGLANVTATYDAAAGTLTFRHALGGDFELMDGDNTPLDVSVDATAAYPGWTAYNPVAKTGTPGVNAAPTNDNGYEWLISNWRPLVYVAQASAPYTTPADGSYWYSSVLDADIMINDGSDWRGYRQFYPATDVNGPIIAATEPTAQSTGGALVTGDIWVSTANMEMYGKEIYTYNGVTSKWELQDVTDQTTPTGWLFADARWGASGQAQSPATINALLTSDYVDPDCPDPALYPRGMKLWNTRRSGYNVKRYVAGHINISANSGANLRYTINGSDVMNQVGSEYFADRWVTFNGTNEDGSGKFGRHAQRGQVVAAMKAMVDTNAAIRDTDTLVFNLIAAPGYPEAIANMVSFNTDRGQTAFVVGDTPFRLQPTGTALTAWGNNTANAFDNGDDGAVSYDNYMAMFYPSGFTNDNTGNNIVVPPSHMMLRTIVNSDAKSYQWFAPAGTRRGGVDNATSVGYIDSASGEFKTASLHQSLRDVLQSVNVNPIATLPGVGIVNFGQKTRAPNASALDRINVARLVAYLRRQLSILAKPYLFEPNDAQTRREIKAATDSLLLELVGQRALYDFLVVCDTSNNTPARIDRSELWLDIAIEPVKAVEFIYIPLRIKNTGDIAAGL
jgi:hypothetical protein